MQRASTRQLEYVVAVAEERHFGRASKRCFVTQPALSAQIQTLEELLEIQIFERGRRGVVVTAAGEAVVERARAALRELDAIGELARAARAPLHGRLRMGVIPTVAPYLLPAALPRVREAHPALRLELREDQTARLVAQLEAGDLDLLLLALPIEGAALSEHVLFEEPFVLAAPKGHPLAKPARQRVDEAALDGHTLMLLEEGHCLRAHALSVCDRAGAAADDGLRATSLGTLVQMVANGLGATLLPERAVPAEVHAGSGIVVRRFRAPEPTRQVGLAWRPGSARDSEFALLAETIAGALR